MAKDVLKENLFPNPPDETSRDQCCKICWSNRQKNFLSNVHADSTRHLLQSLKACGRITFSLVSLNLLFFQM